MAKRGRKAKREVAPVIDVTGEYLSNMSPVVGPKTPTQAEKERKMLSQISSTDTSFLDSLQEVWEVWERSEREKDALHWGITRFPYGGKYRNSEHRKLEETVFNTPSRPRGSTGPRRKKNFDRTEVKFAEKDFRSIRRI